MTGKNPLGNGKEPQSYEGINIIVPIGGWQLIKSLRAPTTNDKKYPVGSIWIDTASNAAYILTSAPGNWNLLSGLAINSVSTTTRALLAGNLYISNNAALSTFTLPVFAAVGDTFTIVGSGAGFWTIAQNAGQAIKYNAATTTTGVTGSITSTQAANTMQIICTVANTTFTVLFASGAQAAYTVA
jgi:hypothetical protein